MSLGLKDLDITERIREFEYSSGESIIMLRQRRDIASAILLSTPLMKLSLKLNSLKAMYHRTIIGLEASLINNKLR